MNNIKIADISLRESEQSGANRLSFKEKLETAKLLEKLRIDVIETSFVSQAPADAAFIRTLAATMEYSAVCVPVTLDKEGADRAWSALSKAKKPRLNVIVPTSTVQMEYTYGMKADTVQKLAGETAAHCLSLCPDVEFTAEDSTRAEPEFLAALLKTAISAGVKTVTLCDSAGELLPDEFSGFISSVYDAVPELKTVALSLHFKDTLGLGSAAALAGIGAGAAQIKVSAGGTGGTLMLEEFLNIIKIRGETLGIESGINTTALQRTCTQLAALNGTGRAAGIPLPLAGDENQAQAELPVIADIESLGRHIESLGYDILEDDLKRVFAQFEEIARSKKVDNRDIEALIAETAGQAAATYRLENYVINSGSAISATAVVEITKDGVAKKALSIGDGPIDAAFLAAEQVLGGHYELEEFSIKAVTEGREATGDALVKLRCNGKLYAGRGVSTDIIAASIRAYLSAVNKIVYEERNGGIPARLAVGGAE